MDRRRFVTIVLLAVLTSACGRGRFPEVAASPAMPAAWYDAVLGVRPHSMGVLRPARFRGTEEENIVITFLDDREARAWASASSQIDVVDHDVTVLHGNATAPPPRIAAALGPARVVAPGLFEHEKFEKQNVFRLADGTWIFTTGSVGDAARAVLARNPSAPPPLPMVAEGSQLVVLRQVRAEREWVVTLTRIDGELVSWIRTSSNQEAREIASRPIPAVYVSVDVVIDGADLFTRVRRR